MTERRPSWRRQEAFAAWGLALPATVLLWLFLLGPAAAVIVLAFTDWQFGATTFSFVGLGNFTAMAQNAVFRKSLVNTLLYVGTVVPGSVLLGLAVALLVEAGESLRSFYRVAYFLPVTSTLIAMAIVWEFMLHPSVGVVNRLLESIGVTPRDWLQGSDTALATLAAIGIWQAVGLNMVLFIAGLQSIPRVLYEALAMDGARSAWDRFRLVTWPMLGPVTLFVVTITAIRSFQVFDTVAVLTEGGPNKATEVLLYSIYQEGFSFLRAGYGSAITVVFLAFVLVLTLLQMRLSERHVHYG